MKTLLTIISFLIINPALPQDRDIWDAYLKIKPTDKNAIQIFQNILTRFDSTDLVNSRTCAEICEQIGDLYKSHHNYQKAIAYYDSIYTKYRDMTPIICGNFYYGTLVRKRVKVAQCFVAMKDTAKALEVLAPFIFNFDNDYYCDDEISNFYIRTLKAKYRKDTIRNMLDTSLNNITYAYTVNQNSNDDSTQTLLVEGQIWLFNVQFEIAHYTSTPSWDKKVPAAVKKEYFIRRLKETKIFKQIYE